MSTRYKRTDWVRRKEDFSSGAASGFGFGRLLLPWLLAGFISSLAYAVPITTNYQGYLESAGAPLNATVDMTFALYDEGAVSLWTETHQDVEVSNGVFSLVLGSITAFNDKSLKDGRFLGIAVGGDAEMSPRQELTSGFSALRAGVADTVKAASVDSEAIADGAVTDIKIKDSTITGAKIAVSSITADRIAAGVTITAEERLKLGSVVSDGSSPTFENLDVKKHLKVGENSIHLVSTNGAALENEIYTSGTKSLVIQPFPKTTNNVGIGTENIPNKTAKLDVKGIIKATSDSLPANFLTDFGEGLYMRYDNTGIKDDGGEVGVIKNKAFSRLFLTGNPTLINATNGGGNVGIGQFVFGSTVREPEAKLHVYGSSNPNIKLQSPNGNNNYQTFEIGVATCNTCYAPYAKTGDAVIRKLGASHNLLLNMPNNNNDGKSYITFGDEYNGRTMSVFNNGTVAIGTTTPANWKTKLTIDGKNYHALRVINDNDHDWGYNTIFEVTRELTKAIAVVLPGTTTDRFVVYGNGDVHGRKFIPESDVRLKKDIEPIDNSLEKVLNLKGVTFRFKEDSDKNKPKEMGFIAQEVEKVIPEVVTTNHEGYKGVDYSKITAVLVEAVKELKAQNDALKAIVCKDHPEEAICQ
ncbi:MAG: tail fiber domain-containing protein [Candidatus Parabeggiatoa sp.]|nr:tail fiber domain-containing protein [Candidatus Parabeggiatoa sp.]